MTKMLAAAALSVLALAMTAPAFATDNEPARTALRRGRNTTARKWFAPRRTSIKSRVINTQSVVEVPSGQVRTRNHLVIRQNTIRHVGVIRHNHTIIEKEVRYKRRAPVLRAPMRRVYAGPVVVNFVTQQYHTVRRPALVEAPTVYPRCRSCHRVLRVRG